VNPPIPTPSRTQPVLSSSSGGQRLLSLLRSLDTDKNKVEPQDYRILRETVAYLQELVATVQRQGFLRGDTAAAEQVLAATARQTNATTTGRGKNRSGKRGRNNKNSNNDLTLQTTDGMLDGEASAPSAALDSQLLLSAMSRVLVEQPARRAPQQPLDDSRAHGIILLPLTADLCTAACEYLKTRPSPADPCFLAEYELVAAHGKAFLAGLERHARALLAVVAAPSSTATDTNDDDDDDELVRYALVACLRAASSLVSLFGTKLSRAAALLEGLRTVAWTALGSSAQNDDDGAVRTAAATLLAALPLAGGGGGSITATDQHHPRTSTPAAAATLWNRAVAETVDALAAALHTVAPTTTGSSAEATTREVRRHGNNTVWDRVNDVWVTRIREAPLEATKVELFLQLVQALVSVVTSLLGRDAIGVGAATAVPIQAQLVVGAEVPVDAILSLVESMLSCSTAAESKYYGTKKRLRQETIDGGGLVSPASLAGSIANRLRQWGHVLLDSVVSALGASALVPYARRVTRVAHTALVTSSSSALRQALLDPAAGAEKKNKRWLHTAVSLRVAAMQSFRGTLLAFGTDPRSLSTYSTSGSTTSRSSRRGGGDMDRALSIVCGTVVEELTSVLLPAFGGDWGTLDERVQLVSTALDCLVASLNSGGEYLSTTIRGLIDSVASTCLSAIPQQGHPIVSHGSVKRSILSLGASCVATPWQDGATCSTALVSELKRMAAACQQDRDTSVALAAVSALRVCDALDCPRAPALNIVTRSDPSLSSMSHAHSAAAPSSSKAATAASIVDKLQIVRDDMQRNKQREEDAAAAPSAAAASLAEAAKPNPPKKLKSGAPAEHSVPPTLGNEPASMDRSTPTVKTVPTATREEVAARRSLVEGAPPRAESNEEKREGQHDTVSVPADKVDAAMLEDAGSKPKPTSEVAKMDNDDDDEDAFPMIVDCGPDGDDE